MAAIGRTAAPMARPGSRAGRSRHPSAFLVPISLAALLTLSIYLFSSPSSRGERRRGDASQTAQRLTQPNDEYGGRAVFLSSGGGGGWGGLPPRLRDAVLRREVVGDRVGDVKAGKATVEEVLHEVKLHGGNAAAAGGDGGGGQPDGQQGQQLDLHDLMPKSDKPPMTLEEISSFIVNFLHQLHEACAANKQAKFWEIWQVYHDLAVKTLYPWDREYLQRMPVRREDDSIFLSLASYRDENCLNTLKGAYEKSKNPDKLFVGLVQQNCEKNCRSGVLSNAKMEDVEPDQDCHKLFCESTEGKPHCDAGRVRALHVDEDESLGPYAARYFASKLWYGEEWFMQIDAHMFFAQDWDATSVGMLQRAPSRKPVISHYPPPHGANLEQKSKVPAPRLCGPVFATSDLEAQMIRLEGSADYDSKKLEIPRFAPFTAAGYFVAHSEFLREVPFDPFLPWIFMGEEIIMSSRLWTHGYDIFSPTHSVLSHIYVRRHKPKFWESVHRVFTFGVHNPLQMLILNRIKYQLGYPEAARDMIKPKSILTAVEQYSMGNERSVEDYLKIVGLDMKKKEVVYTGWCETGQPPPGFEQYTNLYA